jgi:hypothetical protein
MFKLFNLSSYAGDRTQVICGYRLRLSGPCGHDADDAGACAGREKHSVED